VNAEEPSRTVEGIPFLAPKGNQIVLAGESAGASRLLSYGGRASILCLKKSQTWRREPLMWPAILWRFHRGQETPSHEGHGHRTRFGKNGESSALLPSPEQESRGGGSGSWKQVLVQRESTQQKRIPGGTAGGDCPMVSKNTLKGRKKRKGEIGGREGGA